MKKEKYHAGVLGAGMISGAYLDNMTSRFDILQVDAIGNRSVEKAERAAEKYGIRIERASVPEQTDWDIVVDAAAIVGKVLESSCR